MHIVFPFTFCAAALFFLINAQDYSIRKNISCGEKKNRNIPNFGSFFWNISSSIKLYFPERGYNRKLISLGLTYEYCLPLASHFTNRPLLKWRGYIKGGDRGLFSK